MQFFLKTFDSFNTTILILNVEIYEAKITLRTGEEKHGKSLERPGNYKKTVSARAMAVYIIANYTGGYKVKCSNTKRILFPSIYLKHKLTLCKEQELR